MFRSWRQSVRELGERVERLEGELGRLNMENADLKSQLKERDARIAKLESVLEESRRAGKRQAAPFSKDKPKRDPKKPGRKPGSKYGRQAVRAIPVPDKTFEAPCPEQCPCGGKVGAEGSIDLYQVDIPPIQPETWKFVVGHGHCQECGRRVRGQHPLLISKAFEVGTVHFGPRLLAFAAFQKMICGVSYDKIRLGFEQMLGFPVARSENVQVPQIRETSTGFRSKILDAYVSRTEKLDELIARMYVHGMSTRDIEATFADVLSGTGVSKSVVSRVTQCLSDDFEVFRKRDLSSEELLYLELDGTFLRYHQGAEKKEPILVATGYRIDGTRVLLHIGVGNGESYANWKGFLQEMVARGLREPLLIVTDGNPGVLKAIEEVFPQSLKQRCQKHRLENILGKAPKEIHDELKAEILESFHAKSYEQGLKKGREVITRYRQRFPSAMNGMEETLEACLQVLRLPEAHHKRLRTSNLLERTFGELKRRTKVIPHFFTEQAAIKLSFAVLLATASKWRGVRMDVFTIRRIEELRNEFLPKSTSEEPAA